MGDPPAPAAPAPAPAPAAASVPDIGGLDFNLDLDSDKTVMMPSPPKPAEVDLSAISFDLGTPDAASAPAAEGDARWQEVATKLDLAKAYEEMGDKDGAKDLLNEVAAEGDDAQKNQARQMLSKLG
jgi:pilus assembly protein FimV